MILEVGEVRLRSWWLTKWFVEGTKKDLGIGVLK